MKPLFIIGSGNNEINGEYEQVSDYYYKNKRNDIVIEGKLLFPQIIRNKETNPWIWMILEEGTKEPFFKEDYYIDEYPVSPIGLTLSLSTKGKLPKPRIICSENIFISILLSFLYNIKKLYENFWKDKRAESSLNTKPPFFPPV